MKGTQKNFLFTILLLVIFLILKNFIFLTRESNKEARTSYDNYSNDILSIRHNNHEFSLLMINNDASSENSRLSIQDKVEYSLKHNYSLLIDNPKSKDRQAAWYKLISVLDLFEKGFKWVWCLDRDTIITNHNIQVYELLNRVDEKYSLILSKDCNSLNTGSMFLRNTNWSINFIKKVYATYGNEVSKTDVWYENKAFKLFFDRNENNMLDNILLVPQSSINIYPKEVNCHINQRHYIHGDFLLHFAGIMHDSHNSQLYKKYYLDNRLNFDKLTNFTTKKWLEEIMPI